MQDYLIVHKSIVPDYFMKVIEVNNAMKTNKYSTISKACKAVNISRSTYYKYKDFIFLLEDKSEARTAIISLMLAHKAGVLSKVLNILNENNTSVLTISQALPVDDFASVLLSIDINNINTNIEKLINKLNKLCDVSEAKLLSIE